ncbi:MAG: DUF3137 domain-containing protein [Candidatus Sumerlaeia bacterium]|nr:DUF3137 domain-containing protein [Candidatus Sumerlaeia bacterium]
MLRQLFGPPLEEVWSQFAAQLGAEFRPWSFGNATQVRARVGVWEIVLDAYVEPAGQVHVPMTRLRAPFSNPSGFRFSVQTEHFFHRLGKSLGLQSDIEVGEWVFDKKFVVTGSNRARVVELLGDAELRARLLALQSVSFSVRDHEGFFGAKFPPKTDMLLFQQQGHCKDLNELKTMFEVFALTLGRLAALDPDAGGAPGVVLR